MKSSWTNSAKSSCNKWSSTNKLWSSRTRSRSETLVGRSSWVSNLREDNYHRNHDAQGRQRGPRTLSLWRLRAQAGTEAELELPRSTTKVLKLLCKSAQDVVEHQRIRIKRSIPLKARRGECSLAKASSSTTSSLPWKVVHRQTRWETAACPKKSSITRSNSCRCSKMITNKSSMRYHQKKRRVRARTS